MYIFFIIMNLYIYYLFSIALSLLNKPIDIPIIRNKYVELPVVKKLPVDFNGKISNKNKNTNGISLRSLYIGFEILNLLKKETFRI
tara:strand:+ start:360 stop:617 length:258 start_codon:yes stop_codon:yes gene_type:complete